MAYSLKASEYTADPCRASSLPFWKTERIQLPPHLSVLREDCFSAAALQGRDEPYFKMRHSLEGLPSCALPERFALVDCAPADFARHIQTCYSEIGISTEELCAYRARPVYDPALWLAVAEAGGGQPVATGIAELDTRIGEGVLEWIQVSPEYRRMGLGRFLVCELLHRMHGRARFATVSGRLMSESRPMALYEACGFTDPVIWHVVRRERAAP